MPETGSVPDDPSMVMDTPPKSCIKACSFRKTVRDLGQCNSNHGLLTPYFTVTPPWRLQLVRYKVAEILRRCSISSQLSSISSCGYFQFACKYVLSSPCPRQFSGTHCCLASRCSSFRRFPRSFSKQRYEEDSRCQCGITIHCRAMDGRQ